MLDSQTDHTKLRKFAKLLDSQFNVPGTNIRFGIDPILGLVSGIGDLAGASLSVCFMFYAVKSGAKPSILIRMFVNILADLVIGAIPVLGDIFDIAWKANHRNVRLLEKLEQNPDQTEAQSKTLNWVLLIVLVVILLGVIVGMLWLITIAWNKLLG